MMNPYRPRVGQGMFDWIRDRRAAGAIQREAAPERPQPRREEYYAPPPQWAQRYPSREIPAEYRVTPPPQEHGMFKWIDPSVSGSKMAGPGSSSGWLIGVSVAVGFGIAAAIAYFMHPSQQTPPKA